MKKVHIGIHKAYAADVVAGLHEAGIVEILNIWESESGAAAIVSEGERIPEIERCIENLQKINALRGAIEEFRKEKPFNARNILFPQPVEKTRIDETGFVDLCIEVDDVVSGARTALAIYEELMTIRETRRRLSSQIETLTLCTAFDIDLSLLGTSEYVYSVMCVMDPEDYPNFKIKLHNALLEDVALTTRSNNGRCVTLLTTLNSQKEQLNAVLREPWIQVLKLEGFRGSAAGAISGIRVEIDGLDAQEEELAAEMKRIDEEYGRRLDIIHEQMSIEKERMLKYLHFGRTQETVLIEGWVAEKDIPALESLCDQHSRHHAFSSFTDPEPQKEHVPVRYNNPAWLEPFELITSMFARPKYDEIDPTLFIAPMLIAFFALMLGDAGYGILILLGGMLLYYGIGRENRTMQNASIILIVAGGATIISGLLQGSFFGDFLTRFFGITIPFVVINPLEEPIEFLRMALIIGIAQINIGLVLAAYQNYMRRDYRALLHDQCSWFIIQPAAALLLFEFFGWAVFSPSLVIGALVLLVIGFGLVLFKEGPLGFFGITGFLGDWLSYARLLALALATGGIAMTVNILAQMVAGDSPVTMALALLILLIGQTFNFVLQTLGAFIHSLRLQFVEFFGKFYEGGGKEFVPFSAKREITTLNRRES